MNKSEDLKNFKVEELEQRLEMAKWKNESNYACTSGDCRGYIGASYTL